MWRRVYFTKSLYAEEDVMWLLMQYHLAEITPQSSEELQQPFEELRHNPSRNGMFAQGTALF
jgi:hypothetical protein